jgi:hypothetical protein
MKSFPRRGHFLIAEPGWQEVADFALAWAGRNARGNKPRLAAAA